jgi:hypothetical protein
MTAVYLVVRHNVDMRPHMVEVMRVCASKQQAEKVCEEIWQAHQVVTAIERYMVEP